jgi:hypothetical protein
VPIFSKNRKKTHMDVVLLKNYIKSCAFSPKMSSHYYKLTEITNDLAKDIMTITDLKTQVPLLQEFVNVRQQLFKLVHTFQEEKEKEKERPETSVSLPDVVVKAKLGTNRLMIQRTEDYAKSLTSVSSEYRDMVHDFIHTYACTMLSAFMIVDGQCLTKDVTRYNIAFGKFKFDRITVELE